MPRLSPPVLATAGQTRTRAAQPRVSARRRISAPAPPAETLDPGAFNLDQFLVHARDATIVGNADTGRIVLWNPAAERLFGWTADEAIGQPIDMLIPPTILRLHHDGLARYRRTGSGRVIDSDRPIVVAAMDRDGNEVQVDLALAALDQAGSATPYVLAMLRGTSDRRRADLRALEAARAASARDDVAQAMRQHQRLVQGGAEDLGRELQRLRRSTERVGRGEEVRGSTRLSAQLKVVQSRIDRLHRMVDDLATGAAIQARTLEIQPRRVNLVPLVGRIVADQRSRGTPCKLNVAMPQGLTALADPARIEQVVRTLIDQAMRRNPRGCWVDVELRRPLVGLARLEIRDFGRSITERTRQRLLESARADRGLSLSRYLVERHGGTLSVEIPTDGGVRVVVTLPTQRGRVLPGST